jgi:hypothetical protein
MLVKYYSIDQSADSFRWIAITDDEIRNDTDILAEGDFYLMGTDELPAGVEDMRGNILHEPARVYAQIIAGDIVYFGLEAID